jgi:DMSO/TMAO reductase YedYZ heme-binding membrane subunit
MWWYTARAAGVVAWALSAVSVVWGLLLASPTLRRRAAESQLLDLHRFLGGLAALFTAIHLVTVVGADRDGVGIAEVLLPVTAAWRPAALTFGFLAAVLLVVVELTSLLRARVGEAIWRRAHYAGFAVFLFATVHGLRAGTDAENPVLWWPAAVLSAAIVGLCAARLFTNGDPLRDEALAATPTSDTVRPDAAILERTLAGLRNLEAMTPTAAPATDDPGFAVPPAAHPTAAPAPRPLRASQAVSGSLFPSADEMTGTSTRPRGEPPAPSRDDTMPVSSVPAVAPELRHRAPSGPTTPAPAPEVGPVPVADHVEAGARVLPVRTPRRLARTTAAAETIDGWQPTRAGAAAPAAPPAPPTEVDPLTGEPDPQAYRKWLREWLAYVESQA